MDDRLDFHVGQECLGSVGEPVGGGACVFFFDPMDLDNVPEDAADLASQNVLYGYVVLSEIDAVFSHDETVSLSDVQVDSDDVDGNER